MTDDDNVLINIRVPRDLKTAFDRACNDNDMSASQVIRAAMRHYVQENAQSDLLKTKGKRK